MPELIANGPNIPTALLNALDDGRVVFFCGAGISVATGLPGFSELANYVYSATDMHPTEQEAQLLKRNQIDKVLGLLEQRLTPGRLRDVVVDRLTVPSKRGSLGLHKSIASLSTTPLGVRLITTNYDNRFARAGVSNRFIDAAPKLPIPKMRSWHSLVHLHGRIDSRVSPSELVVTAADFGRAYLTERWAARFITELFREFTVVFIGYSLDDPVMGYMVDALAAERSHGVRFKTAYAFADYDSKSNKLEKELEWKGKNVEPILYLSEKSHAVLAYTLEEWARIREDPFQARKQIALKEISNAPGALNDPNVERVIWALQDADAVAALANSAQLQDEKDYPKLEGWLAVFSQSGLLSSDVNSHSSSDSSGSLVGNQRATNNPVPLCTRTRHFAILIANHLHVPQVVAWVLREGGFLHPQLRDEIRRALASKEKSIPEKLRLLWTLMINQQGEDEYAEVWLKDHFQNSRNAEEQVIIDDLVAGLRPRLCVRPGPSQNRALRVEWDVGAEPLTELEKCGHLELEVDIGRYRDQKTKLISKSDAFAKYAFQFTEYLERAIELLPLNEEGFNLPSFVRPSISDHKQNRNRQSWTHLIDLARDSHFALSNVDGDRGGNLLDRWVRNDDDLFKRLVLNAVTEDSGLDLEIALAVILQDPKPRLWIITPDRELLRFLRKAGSRFTPEQLRRTLNAILAGPPDVDEHYKARFETAKDKQREIAVRLRKLQQAGISLDEECQRLISNFPSTAPGDPIDRDEFDVWSGDAEWVGPDDFVTEEQKLAAPHEISEQIRTQEIGEEAFEGLAVSNIEEAGAALEVLSKEGLWPSKYWRRFFWAVSSLHRKDELPVALLEQVLSKVEMAPSELLSSLGPTIGDFIQNLAMHLPAESEARIQGLWMKVWSSLDAKDLEVSDDPVFTGLNSTPGKLAEAVNQRLWKYDPKPGEGFPDAVQLYFQKMGEGEKGHLARVMLAARLNSLFAIDPEWTENNLLSRMNDLETREARDMWTSYAWSPRVGPNLLQALKSSFFKVLRNYGHFGEQQRNLIRLLTSISLDAPQALTEAEIKEVLAHLPEDGLVEVAQWLEDRIEDSEESNASVWSRSIRPWLEKYWPQATHRNTAKTSDALVELSLHTDEEFPDVVKLIVPFLKPYQERGLLGTKMSDVPEVYPRDLLDLLDRYVPRDSIPSWEKGYLKEILDRMKSSDPELPPEHRFQRLYKLATN